MGVKRCVKCGEVKPLDGFYTDKRNPDGRRGRCKVCYGIASRQRYHDPASGRAEYERQWRAANPDKLKANQARWRKRHPERDRETTERWRRDHMDQARATQRAWQAANPVRFREKNGRRRARQRTQTFTGFTAAYMASVYAELAGKPCFYCGGTERITVDHVVPLARGGLHHPDNLVPACLRCNSSKGAKLLHEWSSPALQTPS